MSAPLFSETQLIPSQSNFSEALQQAQQRITLHPGDDQAYVAYGDLFLEMDNYAKAIDNYEKALGIRPDNAETFFKLGHAYEMQEDLRNALNQYQTARKLDPANPLYQGYVGRLLHEKSIESGNINYENEGLSLMEQAYTAGAADGPIREQLAIAYLNRAMSSWRKHPEKEGYFVATELAHIQDARAKIENVKFLYDPSNQAIANRIAEVEGSIREVEKREFSGYPYLRKVPFIIGGIATVCGFFILGILLLAMGVLYHFSQHQPGYLANRQLFKGEYRPPFIVRRLDAMNELLSGITFWDTSFSRLMMTKFLFNFVVGFFRYGMVLMLLPYEITKGFMVNYGLKDQLMAKMRG